MDKITIPITIFESILTYAIRYAIGRKTYAVTEVIEWVTTYKDYLSYDVRKIIIKDIERKIDEAEKMHKFCGMRCDHLKWKSVLEELRFPYDLTPQQEAKIDYIESLIMRIDIPTAKAVSSLAKINRSIFDLAILWYETKDHIEKIGIMSDLQQAVKGIRK